MFFKKYKRSGFPNVLSNSRIDTSFKVNRIGKRREVTGGRIRKNNNNGGQEEETEIEVLTDLFDFMVGHPHSDAAA